MRTFPAHALTLVVTLCLAEHLLLAQDKPPAIIEAARGAGMTGWQRLWRVEIPLALPAILSGIRLSAVISLSTATIGSTVAARTLGEVIIAGLQSNNLAFILQGGLIVAALAVLIHSAFSMLEARAAQHVAS